MLKLDNVRDDKCSANPSGTNPEARHYSAALTMQDQRRPMLLQIFDAVQEDSYCSATRPLEDPAGEGLTLVGGPPQIRALLGAGGMSLYKRIATAVIGLALVGGAAAIAQTPQPAAFVAPAGVAFQINLYPITKFRGIPVVLKENTPRLRLPINAESVQLTRGVWELCSDYNYYGRCVRVNETRVGIPVALTVRSARLVGDAGPLFTDAPVLRAGPDVPIAPGGEIIEARPTPAPVVAPTVELGGEVGTNTSLAGRDIEMFPAPARNGLRVLACAQTPGASTPRCAQATADGFCAERGYRDSGWRETEVVNGRSYLVNVLCKKAEDNSGARSGGAFSIFRN